MSFDLSEFLTEGLISSINNGLIQPELATVYAGNYLAKSLITQNQITQVSDAIANYKAAQSTIEISNSDITPTAKTGEVTKDDQAEGREGLRY